MPNSINVIDFFALLKRRKLCEFAYYSFFRIAAVTQYRCHVMSVIMRMRSICKS